MFSSLKLVNLLSAISPCVKNNTTLSPNFLGQWFNNLWRQWFNNLHWAALLTLSVQYGKILGQQRLFMVNYACGFNQSETGTYFEWIIIAGIIVSVVKIAWDRRSWLSGKHPSTERESDWQKLTVQASHSFSRLIRTWHKQILNYVVKHPNKIN